MARLILSDVTQDVAEVINANVNSPKVIRLINRAQEELLNMGRWVGTTIKYRVCTSDGFITWPRELATIEAISINGVPGLLKNQWFEFMEYGPFMGCSGYDSWTNGWMSFSGYLGGSGSQMALDKGEAISFFDVCGGGNAKKLKVYAQATEDANARILLQFYDGSGNYVRTNDGTEGWQDGEFVAINATTPQTTVNAVTSWVGVQKPVTNDVVRITELDTVTNLERLLAVYQPNETSPSYRRTRVQPMNAYRSNCISAVEVIGSQRFIPALKPRDYLCLQSKNAIIDNAKAIYMKDNNNYDAWNVLHNSAIDLLDKELGKWIGSGGTQTIGINMMYGGGNQNFI